MIDSVTSIKVISLQREGGSESQVGWEEGPTLLETHNTTGRVQLPKEKSTRMQKSQHTWEDSTYTTKWVNLRECNGHYSKFT